LNVAQNSKWKGGPRQKKAQEKGRSSYARREKKKVDAHESKPDPRKPGEPSKIAGGGARAFNDLRQEEAKVRKNLTNAAKQLAFIEARKKRFGKSKKKVPHQVRASEPPRAPGKSDVLESAA